MRRLSLASLIFSAALCLDAQQFNRADNLAPYIPSPQEVVDKLLEAARIKPGETVYDLGCGDGRIIITAAQKYKANAVGIELNPEIYQRTAARVKALGLEDHVKVLHANALKADLRDADVVTLYLLTSSNDRLKPNLERDLKPGARVVSNDFPIPGWKPHFVVKTTAGGMTHNIYVYEIHKH